MWSQHQIVHDKFVFVFGSLFCCAKNLASQSGPGVCACVLVCDNGLHDDMLDASVNDAERSMNEHYTNEYNFLLQSSARRLDAKQFIVKIFRTKCAAIAMASSEHTCEETGCCLLHWRKSTSDDEQWRCTALSDGLTGHTIIVYYVSWEICGKFVYSEYSGVIVFHTNYNINFAVRRASNNFIDSHIMRASAELIVCASA